ncbi:hypothetical protein D4764_20G0005260 [Takifugu flavidus]|uniref:Uncharacterized protein n=1 Tax=Takifugu flavidus TaxID=433684 RepID=A0A5C6NG49_9TELE|nr:hypothetical protein D4764_20G0005260 [Takifugu flavidus]
MDHIIEELDHVNSENQAMVKKEKELQVQLQNIMKENKALEENYQQEKLKHKCINESRDHIIKELDHVNDENQAMAKKEKELQVQMQSLMKENQALEENYQQEKLKHKHAVQELEQSFKKIRCNIIDKLEEKLQQGEEQIISLEEKYLKEVNAHEMTKENLSQTIEELQVKFNREREEKQELEGKYENEKSLHEETQEQLVQANQQNKEKSAKIKELEFQLQQAVVENMWTNENYQEEKSAHKHTKEQLNHFEEFYEKEKTEHRITREELEQCIEKVKELHIRVKEVEEGNLLLEESYQKEKSDLKSMTDKAEKLLQLKDQLQQAGEDNEHIQEKHVAEMSMLRLQCQHALEDLDQAHSENKSMDQKLEEIQKLRESEKSHRDLQIQQLQARDKQFTQDLHACLSVMRDTKTLKQRLVTMKRCYLDSKHAQISEIGATRCPPELRRRRRYRPVLPSIIMGNVRSLPNKMDELAALTRHQREYRESSLLLFTETWLTALTPDTAAQLEGFTLLRADRSRESDIKALLKEKKRAFVPGDKEELKTVQRELRRKMENQLQQNNICGVCVTAQSPLLLPPPLSVTPIDCSSCPPSPSLMNLSLTQHQVRKALKKNRARKATGPDGISSRLLKSCADQLCGIFSHMFNLSLKLGRVPQLWKTSCIVPVPKTPHPKELNSCRPVALTSHLMKTLERLILAHLRPLVSSFMDPLQFAYQPSIGVDDAIIYLLHTSLTHYRRSVLKYVADGDYRQAACSAPTKKITGSFTPPAGKNK